MDITRVHEKPKRKTWVIHSFPPEYISKVSNNHNNANLQFRRLLVHPKYLTKPPISNYMTSTSVYTKSSKAFAAQNQDIIFQQLREHLPQVVDNLARLLNSCQNYELGEQLKLVKNDKKHVVLRSETETTETLSLSSLTPQQFYCLVTTSKESSLRVQDLLAETLDPAMPLLESLVLPNLEALLHHRFGIYPLTKLIERSSKIQNAAEKWALQNFETLVVNEFGSKLLQKLASLSNNFRLETLQILFRNWSFLSENISTVFYLGYLMKISENKNEFTMVKDCILSQIDQFKSLRYNKRILVSFTRYCSDEDLDFIYNLIKSRYLLQETLNDVYFALCLSILLTRNHHPTKFWILEQSATKLYKLLKIRHFRSLCETIMSDMPGDFKLKFLLTMKKFLTESVSEQTTFHELPPYLCFALWLVTKHLDIDVLRQDSRFCGIVVRLFKRSSSRKPSSLYIASAIHCE